MRTALKVVSAATIVACVLGCNSKSKPTAASSAYWQMEDQATIRARAAFPTFTLVSDIGKVRQVDYATNPKLYKIALVMYMGIGAVHPNYDMDGAIIEYLDSDSAGYNPQFSIEVNMRNCIGMFAQSARGDWKVSAGDLQVLQDAWALATGIENGTEDPSLMAKFLNAARVSGMPLDPARLDRDAKAMALIRIKAAGRPPIDFQSKDGTKGHLDYLKNPKLYCVISRFFKVQGEIGESWDITTAQTVRHTFSDAGVNSPYFPYTELPQFISLETRMQYAGNPEAQRKLAELSNYIEGLAYTPRLYDGD